ncbi:Caskin-1 [Colletotrichum fructicola]|nr:Caskin-1 [Colletotrichum fructicola]KAF4931070.1 Caskin-1 [Colletotrichum fructicola]
MASEDEMQEDATYLAGRAAFYDACEAGNLEGLKILLTERPNLNISALHEYTWTDWKTPLQAAVSAGHLDIVGFLLALRVDLETRCLQQMESSTALHYAALRSSPEMVRVLIAAGADAHAKFRNHQDWDAPALLLPLESVYPRYGIGKVRQEHYDTMTIFLELGHDINHPGDSGIPGHGSLISRAVMCNSRDLVKWLVDRGATTSNYLVGLSKVYGWPNKSPYKRLAELRGLTEEDCGGNRTFRYLVEELGLREEEEE